jgi:hypothetical protein
LRPAPSAITWPPQSLPGRITKQDFDFFIDTRFMSRAGAILLPGKHESGAQVANSKLSERELVSRVVIKGDFHENGRPDHAVPDAGDNPAWLARKAPNRAMTRR